MAKKKRKPVTASELAERQQEISVSEFFTKNRHLLGFDNPKRALLTSVKEAVDNALDACEEANILPEIEVWVEEGDKEDRYRMKVRDNGPGIVKEQIPQIFGKLLYGSKFHRLKMSRGQQGIGISAAGMYGHLTTGRPVTIISRTGPDEDAHFYKVVVNTKDNEPKVVKEDTVEWEYERGTMVQIDMEGTFQRGKWSIDNYLEQTAVANPHVEMTYHAPDGETTHFQRATDELPDEPKEIKPHPHGIEFGALVRMLHDTNARKLKGFLQNDFSRVSRKRALEICEKADVYENARPKRIARQEADRLLDAIRDTKIMNPPMDCVSPIGEDVILAGMKKEIKADFYATTTRKPTVYRGIPFVVEAGLAYGGQLDDDKSARLMRFANRVPLLYQAGGCAITRSIRSTNWRQYGLDQPEGSLPMGPVLMVVHVASAWVPFSSESKEAVAAYPEIEKEIRLGLQKCARKLRRYLRKQKKKKEEKRKRTYIKKYIPHIGEALQDILEIPDDEKEELVDTLTGVLKKSRTKGAA